MNTKEMPTLLSTGAKAHVCVGWKRRLFRSSNAMMLFVFPPLSGPVPGLLGRHDVPRHLRASISQVWGRHLRYYQQRRSRQQLLFKSCHRCESRPLTHVIMNYNPPELASPTYLSIAHLSHHALLFSIHRIPIPSEGVKEEHSVFAWAKKGVWSTADTEDATKRRLIDWFRIGFEPLFADYTQSGSWFAVYTLLEVRARPGLEPPPLTCELPSFLSAGL